jgi:hypothetical protein
LNCVAGFAQGRGVTYGAKKHRKQREVLNFDLDIFFPSIAQNRVFGVFRQFFKFNFQVSSILRRLVCYHDHLIQGAPTSPVLSNIILYAFDKQMLELARRTKTVYTRYVDDITFSSRNTMPRLLWQGENLSTTVKKIVEEAGFQLSEEKTRKFGKGNRLSVTGVVVNEKMNVRRTYVRKIRAMLHNFKITEDYDSTVKKFNGFYLKDKIVDPERVLKGMISYVYQIRSDPEQDQVLSRRLMQDYNSINWPGGSRFELKLAIPQKFKRYNAIFAVEVVTLFKDFFFGTAFLCDGKIYSCCHIFENRNEPDDQPKSIKLIEFDPETLEVHKTYKVDKVDLWSEDDISMLYSSALNKTKRKSFNSPAHPLKGPAKVDILGYPEAFQIGEKSRMYTAEETTIITIGDNISQSHKSENSRSVVLLTNDNGGIQSGNSGGPVVSIGNGTVVGIAIRGAQPKDGNYEVVRSEMVDFYNWLHSNKRTPETLRLR